MLAGGGFHMTLLTRRALRAAILLAASASLCACATVTRGTRQSWTVETDPSGAAVKTSAGFTCEQTPCTFKLKRKNDFEVTISKPGYKTYHGQVTHDVSTGGAAGMAGNVLVGGLIGIGVDAATGAMMNLKPNPLKVKLEPADSSAPSSATQ